MTLGGRDTRDITLLTGVDLTVLRNFQLQDGTNFEVITGQLTGALAGLNGEINSDPLFAGLSYVSDQPEVNYRMGSSASFDDHTEYSRPDPNRASLDGHMVGLKQKDFGLRWTYDYLQKEARSMGRVDADIQQTIDAGRKLIRTMVLNRLLRRADDTGAANGLGAGGISPGFATTAASTGVDFTPPEYGGVAFAATHEHYTAAATSITLATVVTMMKNLREHGHDKPYDLLISQTDEAAVMGFAGFIAASDPLITQLASTDTRTSVGGDYIGYLPTAFARVRVVNGWPASYMFMYKSYGPNSINNPLRLRTPKGDNAVIFRAAPDPAQGAPSPAAPLATLIVYTELGVGTNSRTNGVSNFSVGNATWADGASS
jgi:hypothetical protein